MPVSVLPFPLINAECIVCSIGPNTGREIVPHYSSSRRELLACQHGATEEAGCLLHSAALE